jgi:hypothetical protein
MAKETRRVEVLQSLSKSEVETLGGNRWFWKHLKVFMVVMALSLVLVIISGLITKPPVAPIIGWSELLGLTSIWYWVAWKIGREGKKFWNKIKDMPQPVDLRK